METDPNYMTPAERLASHVLGTAPALQSFRTKQVSFRMPLVVVARLDALCAKTGMSRTETAGLLLAAGFYASLDLLPSDVRAQVESDAETIHQDMLAEGDE